MQDLSPSPTKSGLSECEVESLYLHVMKKFLLDTQLLNLPHHLICINNFVFMAD